MHIKLAMKYNVHFMFIVQPQKQEYSLQNWVYLFKTVGE